MKLKNNEVMRKSTRLPTMPFLIGLTVCLSCPTAYGQVALQTTASCSPSFSNDVRFMGRSGGLTVVVPAGCAQTGWGFDVTQAVNVNNAPAANYLTIDHCQSNLNRGRIVLTGTRSITYTNTSNVSVTNNSLPVRCIIQFTTTDNVTTVPLMRNGNIIFRPMGAAYHVNLRVEADASALVSPLWPHTANDGGGSGAMSGWSPYLTMFDRLSTPPAAGGTLFQGLVTNFYKLDTYTLLSGNPPTNVTRTQTPTSVTTMHSQNLTGVEISATNGTTGITYTYANNTGSPLGIGFDAATAFGYSYHAPTAFNGDGRILYYMASGTTPATDLAGGVAVFRGCTPMQYYNSSAILTTTASVTTQMEAYFQNGSGAAVPATYKDGLIYMVIASGQSGRIRLLMRANVDNLSSPMWNGAALPGGLQPALHLFDKIQTPSSGDYSQTHQRVEFRFFNANAVTSTATLTWTGAVSTAWQNPCNWTCRLPTIDDHVIIPAAGVPNWPTITNYAGVCRTIDVQGTTPANGLIIDGANSGTLQAAF